MDNYIENLRAHRLKVTPQRAAIAEALDIYGHLSVEDLYEILKKKFQTLSLATIYKNINIMMQNAFVAEVKLPEKKSVYELTKEAHSHLLCKNCNTLEDITLDLHTISQSVTQTTDFEIQSINLVFTGLCKQCRH